MERTEQLVRSCMIAETAEKELEHIVSDITSGKATLLHVVKGLGDYLTAEDESVRAKAVNLLSTILALCPADKINRQAAHVLTTFYCDKLDDTETIIPALKGLVPLASNHTLTSEDATTTIKVIFRHVVMKVHVVSTRLLVFTIVDNILSRHREALRSMGAEFVKGYIELAEGEKDPRNLLTAFSISRVILIEFDISNHVEDLFNIIFCYFPISFRPPPDDPYGITPEDLKRTLRSCINATPRFGPLAMPVFLEKLSAGTGSTKQDTLQTIASCLPIYGVAIARNYASKMWSSFKLEIFQPIDPRTAECALETTQTLIKVIYPPKVGGNPADVPEGLGKYIVEECLDILKEPEKSKAKPAIQVLASLAGTTPFITQYTITQSVPYLLQLFRDPVEISNRPATLSALEAIIRGLRDIYSMSDGTDTTRTYEVERPLDPFKDEVIGVFTVGLKTANSISPSLIGLDAMMKIEDLLTDEEIGFIVHSINELLITSEQSSNDVRIEALNVLSAVSLVAPGHIEETTLPLLFSSLPDIAPSREAYAEHAQYRRILSILTTLCTAPSLFETLVIRLLTKLDLICTSETSEEEEEEVNAAYAHFILTTLSTVLTKKVNAGHTDVAKYIDRLVPSLYNLFIHAALVEDPVTTVAKHPRLIQAGGKVIQQIMQTVSFERQQVFAGSLYEAYFENKIGKIAEGQQSLPPNAVFEPFDPETSAAQKNLILLFTAPVLAFRKEICLPTSDQASFLSKLTSWILHGADNQLQAMSVTHATSSIINKHIEEVLAFVSAQLYDYWPYCITAKLALEKRRQAVQTWTWITKALVVRNHELAKPYVDQLFMLFADDSLSWDSAKAIGEIGSGGEDVLTKKNFAVLKILSTQKFFNMVLPRIIEGIMSYSANTVIQTPYLVALASLIKSVPRTIYAHEMSKLLPLLLRGLDLPDSDIRANVIETLHSAVTDTTASGESVQSAVSEHASSLVSIMLKNCRAEEQLSIRLRQVALRFLGILPQVVRYDILHPYKPQVLRELGKSLDDPKRNVRKEAVDARTNWYAYHG